MAQMIGYVPAYADEATGDIYVNPDAGIVGGHDEDDSGFLGPRARLRRLERRGGRIAAREAKIRNRLGYDADDDEPAPADIYQAAAASGMVNENQFNGLGFVALAASAVGFISDTVNRNLWGKSLVLDSDDPSSILVTAISIAGLPINVGSQGTPLSMFKHDSTRFGISFGRKLGLVGQTILVNLQNIDAGAPHTVSGGIICDELNPYAMQTWMERMLLEAAVSGFQP